MPAHLLHVGFPKAGSNFLRGWFRQHPQLAYCDGGIAGFRDVHAIVRAGAEASAATGVRYHVTSSESFTAPHSDSGRLHQGPGDTDDPAGAQERMCRLLAALFPGAHILVVTRGFRSMILSSFSQYVRSGAAASFEEFVAGPLIGHAWDYDRVIRGYQTAFGIERVTVMPFELLHDDAALFVRTLELRLGLTHVAPGAERVNARLSPVELYWYPRLARVVAGLPLGARLKSRYRRGVFENRFRHAVAVLQRLRPGTPVTADLVPDHLIDAYRSKAGLLRGNALFEPYAGEYYGADPPGSPSQP